MRERQYLLMPPFLLYVVSLGGSTNTFVDRFHSDSKQMERACGDAVPGLIAPPYRMLAFNKHESTDAYKQMQSVET